ncbi:hypothetical protein HRG_006886 [Hirsutella rhossiliensis]|uniref:Uncharacterized protein n=1 Tax=Hirsutella rhossiliensis TaxID=111463 RepID=A0A9P8SIA0_9HYPO|nr:uncharacterized protein HRG_06886 [Hirsutella rhossiliensis]KAH0961806.1 hypothetical protein HRG_06886 [Hirsutella rhossiliensis]
MNYPNTRPLIPSWSPNPIPNLSLSAGGLLALADLNTIAQRTVIAGGSSWLDALVLAPGLHYQQAADALDHKLDGAADIAAAAIEQSAAPTGPADQVRYVISNAALVSFLRRLWTEAAASTGGGTLTLDVAMLKDGGALGRQEMEKLVQRVSGFVHRRPPAPASALPVPPVEMDWLSHVLYLLSPLLTTLAVTLMILLGDWWGLAFIFSLMLSRILNIWSIKQRSRPDPKRAHSPPLVPDGDRLTEYAIDLGHGRRAVLRGLNSDLQAVTTQTWLRAKSNLDGYLEAAAKLLVYLVAAFSGNLSQAGAIVLMALLLVSAGLLGLSNAHARGLQMNGRVARVQSGQQHAMRQRQTTGRMQTDRESGSLDAHTGESLLPLS